MSDSKASGSKGADPWTIRLRHELAGRRIVVIGALANGSRMATAVKSLGAADVMLVGYGSAPDGWEGPVVTVPRPTHGLLDLPSEVAELPPADLRLIESFDRSGDALVIGPSIDARRVWDRKYVGHKPRAWQALEDKTTVDQLWDSAGFERAPSLVVAATAAALREAAARIDMGAGTVWSGDTATGRADGAELVFWVRDETQAVLAATALGRRCDRARVMPYLRGIPCSIHAIVGPDGAAVMRPVENVTFRRPDGRFLWAGTHTWWDPRDSEREEMRRAARLIAGHVAETVGYRGPMGIDGIMTEGGFVPTELNARWTFGMWPQAMVCPVPLDLVASFVSSGLDGPMNALEDAVVTAADSTRWGGPTLNYQSTARMGAMPLELQAATTNGGAQASAGKLWVSGSNDNATVTVRPDRATSAGLSLLSLGLTGFALADEHFGTGIGPLLSPDDEP